MPKRKRSAYRNKRSEQYNSKKRMISDADVVVAVSVTPEVIFPNPPAIEKGNDHQKRTTFCRELKGLSEKDQKRNYVPRDSGNRIIHWNSMKSLICGNAVCKKCFGDLNLTETTVGIATEVTLHCKQCESKKKNVVRQTDTKKMGIKKNCTASFSLNVQFVLALMQLGGGNSESETLLNFLDLPHGSTFKKKSFPFIQKSIRKEIVEISNASMQEALDNEIERTVSKEMFGKIKKKENSKRHSTHMLIRYGLEQTFQRP